MKPQLGVVIIMSWLLVLSGVVGWLGWQWYEIQQQQSRVAEVLSGQPELPADAVTQEINSATVSGSVRGGLEVSIASLSARVEELETQLQSQQSQPRAAVSSGPAATTQPGREYFVPLGGGSTYSRDWTLLSGAAVDFHPSKYQPIKKVYFEAAGSILGGEVHAVLVDVTHNVVYYNSMVVFNTSNPTWQRSQPIVLSNARSQLQVQILSTSGELAVLNDSRLVIETGN